MIFEQEAGAVQNVFTVNWPFIITVCVKTKGWTVALCPLGVTEISLSQAASAHTSVTLCPALIPAHICSIMDAHTYYDNWRRSFIPE